MSVFEKLRFRDRLVWTEGLTLEITEAAFLNSSDVVWTGAKRNLRELLLTQIAVKQQLLSQSPSRGYSSGVYYLNFTTATSPQPQTAIFSSGFTLFAVPVT